MRLLTLATLGFKNIGQNLPYIKIAEALHVNVSEVEKWVIDGISFYLPGRYFGLTVLRSHPCWPPLG